MIPRDQNLASVFLRPEPVKERLKLRDRPTPRYVPGVNQNISLWQLQVGVEGVGITDENDSHLNLHDERTPQVVRVIKAVTYRSVDVGDTLLFQKTPRFVNVPRHVQSQFLEGLHTLL
jgi:hypothetical protein